MSVLCCYITAIALVRTPSYYCYALKLSWWWDGSKATHLMGLAGRIYPGGTSLNSPGGPFYMIPGGIIGHEGGPCIILLLVPLGPVNILYLVWGTNSDI